MKSILTLILLLSVNSFAAEQSLLDKLAGAYYSKRSVPVSSIYRSFRPMHRPQECQPSPYPNPNGPSCADVACQYLGSFGCDDISQIEKVGAACRGNYDGTCLDTFCKKMGSFGCDEIREVERVAAACRGNYSNECAEVVCGKMGSFGCDELSEVERVATACRAVDAQCVESVCSRLGTFGCDELAEIERVTASCRGN